MSDERRLSRQQQTKGKATLKSVWLSDLPHLQAAYRICKDARRRRSILDSQDWYKAPVNHLNKVPRQLDDLKAARARLREDLDKLPADRQIHAVYDSMEKAIKALEAQP